MTLKPSTLRVLQALRDASPNGLTTNELCQPEHGGVRFGARIEELRDKGYVIETERIRNNSHRYRLVENQQLQEAIVTPWFRIDGTLVRIVIEWAQNERGAA